MLGITLLLFSFSTVGTDNTLMTMEWQDSILKTTEEEAIHLANWAVNLIEGTTINEESEEEEVPASKFG